MRPNDKLRQRIPDYWRFVKKEVLGLTKWVQFQQLPREPVNIPAESGIGHREGQWFLAETGSAEKPQWVRKGANCGNARSMILLHLLCWVCTVSFSVFPS
jgi:hypothetical protein